MNYKLTSTCTIKTLFPLSCKIVGIESSDRNIGSPKSQSPN